MFSNFGRFHPRYCKSRNKKENLRGHKLAEGRRDNPVGGPSIPPLEVTGEPGTRDWMGLKWTARTSLTSEKVLEVKAGAGFYAQSEDIKKRLNALFPVY